MNSTKYFLLFLSLLLSSCVTKQDPESKEWTALSSVIRDSLIVTDVKEFKTLNAAIIQNSDYFLKLYQNSVSLNNQLQNRNLLAEIIDKNGSIINSIRITTDYPKTGSQLIRRSVYFVGEAKLCPFNNVNEFSNLYKKFDELSSLLENKKNQI